MARSHILSRKVFASILLLTVLVFGYEKTLRKIVRSQSKMVQRPFSEIGKLAVTWLNSSEFNPLNNAITLPGFPHINTMLNKKHRSKISTILSSVESSKGKTAYQKIISANTPNELRLTRNTNLHLSDKINVLNPNKSPVNEALADNNQIPSSIYFPPIDDHDLQSIELKTNSKESTILIPEKAMLYANNSALTKGLYKVSDLKVSEVIEDPNAQKPPVDDFDAFNEKPDYVIAGSPVTLDEYLYNVTANPYVCAVLKGNSKIDIRTQERFSEFDIEPLWISRRHFWDAIYDSRYESLMRNLRWPALKVKLIPRTHVDSIWKKTFDQYHEDSVAKILSNVVKKLQFYSNLTFTWNEVSHLSRWWSKTSQKSRSAFRKLLKSGRLEITTGGWVETDEATTHLFGLIHQLIEGQEWLKQHLNYLPEVAWLTNSVAHSPTMAYLLSVSDISHLVLTNVHYSWEQYLAEYQYSDFLWVQNWDDNIFSTTVLNKALNRIGKDRHPKHSVLTHCLPFNSAGFKSCGPNSAICSNDFNFAKSNKNLDINTYNVKQKSETLLEQYSKTGTTTPHNIIMAPLGNPYAYESQAEFDYQYNNYEKIADFININRGIYKAEIEFGTPKDYFKTIVSKYTKYPTLSGDFLNFADVHSGSPAYWVGYYTSRPFLKIMLRRLESTLRSTEILFSFALNFNALKGYNISHIIDDMVKARETIARLLDRNVISGTLPGHILRYVHKEILTTVNKCWRIQEISASLLTSKPGFNQPYLHKYVYREGEFISTFKTVSPEDHIYLFNSLSHERTEVVELITRYPNIRIVDHNKKDVTVQINPVWKYNSDNVIKISTRFFKIHFAVIIPPMTLELFKIKEIFDGTRNAASVYCSSCIIDDVENSNIIFPFNIQPIQTGDIQLESYKHRLIFDEQSGFLKTVIEKETNIEKTVLIDFGAFRDANINAGVFLFNTNVTRPLHDVLLTYRIGFHDKVAMIITGSILTEISSIYGRLLQHTVKIFNLVQSPLAHAIYFETKIDFEVSPKNRDLEMFMSIQTDISNGQPPRIVTDNNGFQHTDRTLNLSRRIESNVYPITSSVFIQDRKSRLTYITDHAQGVTALQEGQLIVIMDRRVLFNDGRGTDEGLADNRATCHRSYILLENFIETSEDDVHDINLKLPSASAAYLASSLNYLQEVYLVEKNKTGLSHFSFLPLIKTSFPCDVAVVNLRVVLRGPIFGNPNTALLVLHRRSISCNIMNTRTALQCNGESNFSLDKIIRNLRAVYQTNLAGTNKGTPLLNFSPSNFPPMELTTLRIYF